MLSFYKVRKAKLLAVWLAQVKAGDTTLPNIFKKFGNCPMNIEVNEFDTLCNFAYEAYGLTKQVPFKTWRKHLDASSISIWSPTAYKTSIYPGWLLLKAQ